MKLTKRTGSMIYRWFIDENEPSFDKRIKNGKYIGRRKKKAIEKEGT